MKRENSETRQVQFSFGRYDQMRERLAHERCLIPLSLPFRLPLQNDPQSPQLDFALPMPPFHNWLAYFGFRTQRLRKLDRFLTFD